LKAITPISEVEFYNKSDLSPTRYSGNHYIVSGIGS